MLRVTTFEKDDSRLEGLLCVVRSNSRTSAKGGQLVAHPFFWFWVFALPPLCAAESRRLVRGCRRGLMKQLAIRLSWQKTPAKSLVMSERVARIPAAA